MVWGSNSFATFLILCPTSFFLGLLFAQFPYDYPILWTATPPAAPDPFGTLEAHLRLLHASPALIPRILHIVVATGLLGFVLKLYRASESNYLFDGASLVLYLCALVVYLTNIVTGLRLASARAYDGLQAGRSVPGAGLLGADAVPVGREDALRVLSASNTICALVLVGVLVLQAGQWYAERKEGEEAERARRERAAKVKAVGGLAGKKKA